MFERRQAYPRVSEGVKISAAWLFHGAPRRIFGPMKLEDGSTLVANLTTTGRKTGKPRTVELRFIYHRGCFYASSSRVEGKHWCQNMLQNPAVEINANGERLACTAKRVTDEKLRQQILALRDSPPLLDRVVFEIKPSGVDSRLAHP